MEDRERQPSRAEQRMLAVAKLKRAASLPRMKDGRRPPMHTEALSEGEKPPVETELLQDDEEKKDEESESPPPEDAQIEAVETEADADVEDRAISPRPSRAKRRSRSRSRSRGSKDFKVKARSAYSPTPGPLNHGDSSQDDEPPLPSQLALPIHPQLLSPIPSHFALINQRLLRSPTPGSPEPAFFHPGSPATPVLLPTLAEIQKGLLRSNSAGSAAASRRLAMHKLTGGTDTYDPSPSPTLSPIPGKLGRNNTIAGGERTAARELMLSRLGGRITKETDGEQGSGSEDRAVVSPAPYKRRRRRSARGSQTNIAPSGVSDSEFVSTSTNTPQVPPTPLPSSRLDHHVDFRAQSATPNQANSSRHSGHYVSETVLSVTRINDNEQEKHELIRRRSVLVEDEDEDEENAPLTHHSRYPGLPGTPPNRLPAQVNALRVAHGSDAPSSTSTDSTNASPTAVGVPVYLSHTVISRHDVFPSSPFTTPLKERTISDDDDEQIMYHGENYRSRTPHNVQVDNLGREISWVAEPVPIRMVIDNDDDDEEEEEERDEEREERPEEEDQQMEATEDRYDEQEYEEPPLSAVSSTGFSREVYDDTSPRLSVSSKGLVVESEALPESQALNIPPSPSSIAALSQTTSMTRASNGSLSSQTYPQRLSIASPVNGNTSDWDERDSSKRAETASPTFWEKMKGAVSRAGSSAGRRSRTNSIATRERRDHTDSSISRESGISLTGSKTDRGDSIGTFVQSGPQPLMQSPSASASILSLGPPYTPSRGGPSPIPPPSSSDLSKYQDAKLFPFPGMIKLEEERNRTKGLPAASSSTPDVTMLTSASDDNPPIAQLYSGVLGSDLRDRKPNASDTRLAVRYAPDGHSTTASLDYLNAVPPAVQSSSSQNSKLPMTFPDVIQWLSKNKKKGAFSQGSSPALASPPAIDTQGIINTIKKPSLSDLLKVKDNELGTDWEELPSARDASASGETLFAKKSASPEQPPSVQLTEDDRSCITSNNGSTGKSDHITTDNEKTPKAKKVMPPNFSPRIERASLAFDDSLAKQYSSTPDPVLSATPDPSSSLSDYPAASTSTSSSSSSSQYSLAGGPSGQAVLQRLDESLAKYSRDNLWALPSVEDPPRKLVMSSAVLQVINPNTVKDRFLFHFNDLLVIAKPVMQDHDSLIDAYKPSPLDRKFVVKSVVQMRHLRLNLERSQLRARAPSDAFVSKNPPMKAFIHQFSNDPDHAIDTLLSKSAIHDDSVVIGQLLFKTLELNRVQLGEYLSRRSTKAVLKAYLDNFGFVGLRIDKALRVFLQSVSVPERSNALEYLLDAFAGRWYDANAKAIAYDKDFAIRLVRALVQLNEILHGGISPEPGPTGNPLHTFNRRDFLSAFRRFDTRSLVSDDILGEVYDSILQERLCQARGSVSQSQLDLPIIIKRPVPARLTYKMQSEPIILRIPQADSYFTIQLYGQDLEFDPPVLTFAKSPEASFRVTGTSLGSKTMIFCRSGPNALKYSGLPLSNTIVVERTFMRYTFQLAFLNHAGAKRRYMFSFHESATYRVWVDSLKQYIEGATTGAVGSGSSRTYKAAENVAFKILQETLISPLGGPSAAVQDALNHLNGSATFSRNGSLPLHNRFQNRSSHVRSKSRSKLYHLGAGRHELDLRSGSSHFMSSDDDGERSDTNQVHHREESGSVEGLLWSNRDLLIHCQQNSLIPLVLEHLQVWPSDQGKGAQEFTR
ncbi:hypothetical protein BDQ17DRAFT_1419796 [Cyathus striatus]|nr:hypothetical protein BDQ17DRAFT_1419796 [Cyathus striatus]